jgi:hypothetical protein
MAVLQQGGMYWLMLLLQLLRQQCLRCLAKRLGSSYVLCILNGCDIAAFTFAADHHVCWNQL